MELRKMEDKVNVIKSATLNGLEAIEKQFEVRRGISQHFRHYTKYKHQSSEAKSHHGNTTWSTWPSAQQNNRSQTGKTSLMQHQDDTHTSYSSTTGI
jgi:hypothetical protein